MNVKDPEDRKSKIVNLRVTEAINHYLEVRVSELKKIAETGKKHIDKSWLVLRLMELGQDWMASYHLGQPTDFEEWIIKEIDTRERKIKKVKDPREEGFVEGLKYALTLFEKYEELICGIGEEETEDDSRI